jgi:DNA-binding HxlR family transcriptional regulator
VNIVRCSWDLEIVALGGLGVCRFNEFQSHLGISRKVLSERLRWLAEAEILERRKYQDSPERYEYALTVKGSDLLPIHASMLEWRERWER